MFEETYEGAGTNIIQLTQSQGTPHHEKPRVLLPAYVYKASCVGRDWFGKVKAGLKQFGLGSKKEGGT